MPNRLLRMPPPPPPPPLLIGASREAHALPEGGIPFRGSLSAEGAMVEAPLEVTPAPSFLSRLASVLPRNPRIPNQLLLSSYVPRQEWVHPLANIVALGPEGAREIIDCWIPFNKRESSIKNMHDLYPTLLHVSTTTRFKQYSISFLGNLDMETFQRVAKDEMLIHNHNFHHL